MRYSYFSSPKATLGYRSSTACHLMTNQSRVLIRKATNPFPDCYYPDLVVCCMGTSQD